MLVLILAVLTLVSPAPPACAATSPATSRLLLFVDHAPLDVYASAPVVARVAGAETTITTTLSLNTPAVLPPAPMTSVYMESAAPLVLYTCSAGARPHVTYAPLVYSVPSADQ